MINLAENLIPVLEYTGDDVIQMLIRLGLAILLGGLIGLEREFHGRPAGLRTHVLVSVGSALIMMISISGFKQADGARLAAQVVSGIGFLGAGAILRTGEEIKGLTTAATLWIVSAIGLACGNGFYYGAVIATGLSLIVLLGLRNIDIVMEKTRPQISLIASGDETISKSVISLAARYRLNIHSIESKIINYAGKDSMQMRVMFNRGSDFTNIKAMVEELRDNFDLIEINFKR